MKATFGLILIFVAAAFFMGSTTPGTLRNASARTQRPNVVFIVVDDMNRFPILHNYPGRCRTCVSPGRH